jgi:hypothetical protein
MKTVKFFTFLFILISASSFFSCTPENLDYGATTKEMITGRQWSVDYYFAGQDKTAQFSNYKFSFIGNGTLTADNGTDPINGNWVMITDVNRNDVLKINIPEAHLQGLNEQWTVNLSSDVLIMKGSGSEMRLRKL